VVKNKNFNKKKGLPPYNIQFDGFTTTLQAACKVIPGEVYHIQIAIADVADLILDSGVYLEANSFISTGKTVVSLPNPFIPTSTPQTSIKIEGNPIVPEKPAIEKRSCFRVNFDFDYYSLTDSALAVLKEACKVIEYYPGSSIEIVGHTDNIGSDTYNDVLSRNRSATVAHFISSLGIDQSRLIIDSRGEREPIESNETAEGRSQNRRTEVIIKWMD
jgi:outer membrane protein OmpA-like peptidoglycan-associated protein